MRRDWELIRTILGKIEELPDTRSRFIPRSISGWVEDEVIYHLWLLIDAGLIEGNCSGAPGRGNTQVCSAATLTWKGHEFLDTVRSDTAWNRIKRWLNAKALDLSFEAIVAAGRACLHQRLDVRGNGS